MIDAELETVQADLLGDGIIEIGKAALTLAGGQVLAIKYVVRCRQEGGRWMWHTDIWNTNA